MGLKVLKNKLSEYVRLVARGETVLITDRNRVVAELIPPRPGNNDWMDDAGRADLIRKGLLSPATEPVGTIPPRVPIGTTDDLLQELDEDRSDR